jgi:hypothetical protein
VFPFKVRQQAPGSHFFTVQILNPEARALTIHALWAAANEITIWDVQGSTIDALSALPTVLTRDHWIEVTVKQWEPWSSMRVRFSWDGGRIAEEELSLQSGDAEYGSARRWENQLEPEWW